MKYVVRFELPYELDAYEHVTLVERFEREISSFLGENNTGICMGKDD